MKGSKSYVRMSFPLWGDGGIGDRKCYSGVVAIARIGGGAQVDAIATSR